jgi:uncharacterized membrane protein (DUF2068 family)
MAAGDRLLRWIGLFKLAKAAVLIGVGVAGLAELPRELARRLHHAVAWVGLFPGHVAVDLLLGRLWSLDPRTAHVISLLLFGYAMIFLVEAWGLLSHKRWAEWLTVIATGSFIPLEIYEIIRHATPGKIATVLVNLAIVGYLVGRRVEHRGASAGPEVSDRRPARLVGEDAGPGAGAGASPRSRSRGP